MMDVLTKGATLYVNYTCIPKSISFKHASIKVTLSLQDSTMHAHEYTVYIHPGYSAL